MTIIFHHPFPLTAEGRSGTSVRPQQMLQAFRSLGYEVEEVVGHSRERGRRISLLREELRSGRRFDFAYAESHTLPTPLTDPHHLPLRALLDYGFFKLLNRSRVPLGLFYRDIYWRFDSSLSFASPLKRLVTVNFHRLEWNRYRDVVDHLFLPSLGMASALPTAWPEERLSALPPGSDDAADTLGTPSDASKLSLLYVGGVAPPLYDLTPLFAAATMVPSVRVTLCCRAEEWRDNRARYELPANMTVVHAAGPELRRLYTQAHAVVILREPHPYLDFAMPVKLLEAVSFGLPIITMRGSEAARFVDREQLGWVVDTVASAALLLNRLSHERDDLNAASARVLSARPRHTWQARAQQVAATLGGPPR